MTIRIISGGQTGVDQAALDAALDAQTPVGGYCPAGRKSESGPIPDRYPLVEVPDRGYGPRTRKNVAASDATLVVTFGVPSAGTAQTIAFCKELRKPYLILEGSTTPLSKAVTAVCEFLRQHAVRCLNVAGPRASEAPNAYSYVYSLIGSLLNTLAACPLKST